MSPKKSLVPSLLMLLAAAVLAGCAGPTGMTEQQRQGVELRRYCEANPQDVATCVGFLGFM
jgi:hypothetical protein